MILTYLRRDFLDFRIKTIFELKPNNPRQIQRVEIDHRVKIHF